MKETQIITLPSDAEPVHTDGLSLVRHEEIHFPQPRLKQWANFVPHSRAQKRVRRQASPLPPELALALLPAPGWSILIDNSSEGPSTARHRVRSQTRKKLRNRGWAHDVFFPAHAMTVDRCDVDLVTIDMLPDDILLEILYLYVDENKQIEAWYTLAHVCQRWRYIVSAFPRRLNLRLLCKDTTRGMTEMLDIWPALPVVIQAHFFPTKQRADGTDNVIAAMKHKGRICEITLRGVPSSLLASERFATVTQESFPALTHLDLLSDVDSAPALPDSFFDGSAPRLRTLRLRSILYPALGKLLLSASDLVELWLWDIPHSGYISPKAMVTCLSTLTRLETLYLGFHSHRSRPERATRRPPPPTRTLLRALTNFQFKGVSEYLEDVAIRIDAPLLNVVQITFFNQLVFDVSQLSKFIGRTEKLRTLDHADLFFRRRSVEMKLHPQTNPGVGRTMLAIGILCRELEWQFSALAQVCNSSLPLLSILGRLDISIYTPGTEDRQHDMENAQWAELLQSFSAVKNIYIHTEQELVAKALRDLAGATGVTEILPVLRKILMVHVRTSPNSYYDRLERFIAARQSSGHPVTIETGI